MSSVVDVEGAIQHLGNTALRIKAERDEFEAVIRDLKFGADMMLDCNVVPMPNWVKRYIEEVRRVTSEALK